MTATRDRGRLINESLVKKASWCRVTMDVSGDLIKDQAAETRILIARQ
jgi:hypothetical protein